MSELRTASNATKIGVKEKENKTNIDENTKKIEKSNNYIPLAISEKKVQVPKKETVEQNPMTELPKMAVTEAAVAKLPTPMEKVLALNTVDVTTGAN